LAGAKSHRIEPFAYLSALLIALSSNEVDLASLLPDVWIAAHPEHFLIYRRDEAEAAAIARRRRRERRRAKAPEEPKPLRSPRCWLGCVRPTAEELAHRDHVGIHRSRTSVREGRPPNTFQREPSEARAV
jgi:hypothetical protein